LTSDAVFLAASTYGAGRVVAFSEPNAFDSIDCDLDGYISLHDEGNEVLLWQIMGWLAPPSLPFPPSLPTNTLTITSTSGGTTNLALGAYSYPPEAMLWVLGIPSTGYYLRYWELDGSNGGVANPIMVTMTTNHTLRAVFSSGVGGAVVSIDKLGLLAPYFGLASAIIVATLAAAIYVKRVKRRKEKQ